MCIDGSGLTTVRTKSEFRQVPLLIQIPLTPNKSQLRYPTHSTRKY